MKIFYNLIALMFLALPTLVHADHLLVEPRSGAENRASSF